MECSTISAQPTLKDKDLIGFHILGVEAGTIADVIQGITGQALRNPKGVNLPNYIRDLLSGEIIGPGQWVLTRSQLVLSQTSNAQLLIESLEQVRFCIDRTKLRSGKLVYFMSARFSVPMDHRAIVRILVLHKDRVNILTQARGILSYRRYVYGQETPAVDFSPFNPKVSWFQD